jgi:hypothetical protein
MYNIIHAPFSTSNIIQNRPPHHPSNLQSITHTNTIHNQQDNQVWDLLLTYVNYITYINVWQNHMMNTKTPVPLADIFTNSNI